MDYSYTHNGLLAIRYALGGFLMNETDAKEISLARAEILINKNSNITFIGYGNAVGKANNIAKKL